MAGTPRVAIALLAAALASAAVAVAPGGHAGADSLPLAPTVAGARWIPDTDLGNGQFGAFTADAVPDLAIIGGTDAARTVQVRPGTSTVGTFGPAVTTTVGACAYEEFAIGDLDADGELDLVIACAGTGLRTMLGNGDGTFDAPVATAATIGTSRVEIAFADLTGSAALDVAVTTVVDTKTVSVFQGGGNGTLTATAMTFVASSVVGGLLGHDLDSAGRDELVVTWDTPNIFGGQPAGMNITSSDGTALTSSVSHGLTVYPGTPTMGDLNDDGIEDLVVATGGTPSTPQTGVFVLYGTGGGAFDAPVREIAAGDGKTAAIADLDADGTDDLLLGEPGNDNIRVRFGDGSGGLGPERRLGGSRRPSDVVARDLDGDLDVDLAFRAWGPDNAKGWSFLTNPGDGNFRTPSNLPAKVDGASPIIVRDLTGDGKDDLLVGGTTDPSVHVYPGDGLGTVLPPISSASQSNVKGMALGKLDGDAFPDVVTVRNPTLHVLLGNGDGTFDAPLVTTVGSNLRDTFIDDLDDDGAADVVVADIGTGVLHVLLGNGDGTLGVPSEVDLDLIPNATGAGDLDDDGHLDLVVAEGTSQKVAVWLGDGAGGFALASTRTATATPRGLAVGDVNRDGSEDVMVSGLRSGTRKPVDTFLGNGDGTIAAPGSTELNAYSDDPAIGDLNGDGDLDLLIGAFFYLLGNGDGTWTRASKAAPTDVRVAGGVVVDLNGDDVADIAGVCGAFVCTELGAAPGPAASDAFAPLATTGDLVDRLYADLLGRAPTTAERAAAVAAMTGGTLSKGALVAQLRTLPDQTANVDPIVRLYRAYFLRNPDPGGLQYWLGKRRNGATLSSISSQFARSSEFKNRYGSLTNAEFVDLVYQNVLGRPGDPSGVAYWKGRLDRKVSSRGQVMLNFSESSEYKRETEAEVEVSVLALLLLGTVPTEPNFSADVASLEGGQTRTQYAAYVVDTAAYATRVATP